MKSIYFLLVSLTILIGVVDKATAQSLTASYPSYVQGDSLIFSYSSPNFSTTDWVGIYPEKTKPGVDNPAIDWKYIPNSLGTITFKTNLSPGRYDAYLLCCDGYDSISSIAFEIIDPSVAFVTVKYDEIAQGSTLEFSYNDPALAAEDRISIFEYTQPATGTPITYSLLTQKWGLVSFPGVLTAGAYYAVLTGPNQTEYARSDVFIVSSVENDSYIKTAASVYPESTNILVNYKDANYLDKDRIGIYKKGQVPGSIDALELKYATVDSGTVEFNSLPLGEYMVYLFCCDGFDVKATYDFKVVGSNTPSIALTAFSFKVGEPMEFIYNDPNVTNGGTTEWIGIYYEGDIPSAVRSIVWDYLTEANGIMTFSVPYPFGTLPEEDPDLPLGPGEYYAGLFCCDSYGVLAQTSFKIVEEGTDVSPQLSMDNQLILYPNPTNGLVNVNVSNTGKLQKISIYNLTGQVLYQEILDGSVNQKLLDLNFLGKGIYFIETHTERKITSKKLIIR